MSTPVVVGSVIGAGFVVFATVVTWGLCKAARTGDEDIGITDDDDDYGDEYYDNFKFWPL